jgi:penicillin amidase
VRRIGLPDAARRAFEGLGAPARAMLTAYAEGVNAVFGAGIEGAFPAGLLPAPAELWEPWHSCAVYLGRHLWMGSLSHKLFRTALLPDMDADTVWRLRPSAQDELAVLPPGVIYRSVADGPPADWGARLAGWLQGVRPGVEMDTAVDPSGGSNNWAVSGTRTASGKPLLAGDPHRPLETPSPYWQNHVSCDEFDAIGLSFPGVPGFPHFGHTESVAWCITHGMADDQDLFIEALQELAVRTEAVGVRDADAVEIKIYESPRGGVIASDEGVGVGLAFRWTGTAEPDPTMDCLLPMLTVGTADALDGVMRGWVVPVDNMLMADTAGRIRYRLRGRLTRRDRANGWSAVPGWDEAYQWDGWVPFDEMPNAADPDEGFLVSANNRPLAAEEPYVTYDFAGDARAERILALLRDGVRGPAGAEPLLNRAAMERIHADVVSGPARDFLSSLDGVVCTERPELLDILRAWDGTMAADSVAATIYTATRREILAAIPIATDFGALDHPSFPAQRDSALWLSFAAMVTLVGDKDYPLFPDWSGSVSAALDRAAVRLSETLGPDISTWTWGNQHRAVFTPVIPGSEPTPSRPLPGDNETVRAAGLRGMTGTQVSTGSVARYCFDLADWENSGWVVPEQTDEWYDVRLVPMHYAWSEIEAVSGPAVWLTKGL